MATRYKEYVRKLKSNLHLIRTLRLIWSVTGGRIAYALLMILVESILFFASLYTFKLLVNVIAKPSVSIPDKQALLLQYLSISVAVTVLYIVAKSVTTFITEVQASKITEFIDDRIHACAVNLDLAFYESPAYFDTLKRAKDAGPDRPNAILTNLVDLAKSGMMLLVTASALLSISWVLLPLLALFILPTLLVRIKFADILYEWRWKQTPIERKSSYLSSLLTGDASAKEIKAFGLGNYLRDLYLNLRLDLLSSRIKITRKSTINEIITTVLATLGLFACIGYICYHTILGRTSIGDVTLFLIVFPQLYNVMQSLSGGISKLYQNNIFVSNLFALFDLKTTLKEAESPLPIPEDNDLELEVKDVSFTYPHAKEPVLRDINLQIPAGKIVAIVGLNGAGKTTLIKLLCRLYDPTSGSIRLGQTDIRKFCSGSYRKQISVVFQDFGRYNVSVADNIRFGNINGNKDDEAEHNVIEAAKKSGAHDFIKKFPNRYHTIMGRVFEDGQEVSVGQWQKLAIARTFYSDSRFIIFDEATSALDTKAEQELFESFRQYIGNRGALIISHRLSAVKHADYIYVMAAGRIVQHGKHEELLMVAGEYAKIFTKQPVVI